jgi:hypothetical protein
MSSYNFQKRRLVTVHGDTERKNAQRLTERVRVFLEVRLRYGFPGMLEIVSLGK